MGSTDAHALIQKALIQKHSSKIASFTLASNTSLWYWPRMSFEIRYIRGLGSGTKKPSDGDYCNFTHRPSFSGEGAGPKLALGYLGNVGSLGTNQHTFPSSIINPSTRPSCTNTLQYVYPQHAIEFFAEIVHSFQLNAVTQLTNFDPNHLHRASLITDRRLLLCRPPSSSTLLASCPQQLPSISHSKLQQSCKVLRALFLLRH